MYTSRGEQTTFSRVSLDRLRSIQVAVIGEAVNPGDYAVPSFSTVYHVLYRAGGPDENGSYRRIRVIRNNNVVAEMDLYRFLEIGRASCRERVWIGGVEMGGINKGVIDGNKICIT